MIIMIILPDRKSNNLNRIFTSKYTRTRFSEANSSITVHWIISDVSSVSLANSV